MATAPQARNISVRYLGGSVRAPKGNIELLMGGVELSWANLQTGGGGAPGRPYGYRRKANAAAGQPVKVLFNNGDEYTYRVTGGIKAFIDAILARTSLDNVLSIVSERGSEFSREPFLEVVPSAA